MTEEDRPCLRSTHHYVVIHIPRGIVTSLYPATPMGLSPCPVLWLSRRGLGEAATQSLQASLERTKR